MVTVKQRKAAKRNIKKAQRKWSNLSKKKRAALKKGGRGRIRNR